MGDDPVAVFELFESRGWGDGLPVIPPTEERVQAMLDATPLAPSHLVGLVDPRRGAATVEKIAINAVLAGCAPAVFPAVLAAVEAITRPEFNLHALATTTCSATPALMLNGPARDALGIECGYSCLGQPGRLSLCFGEWEERSPWEPFHVRRGFARDESVMTVTCATGTQDIADIFAESGEDLVRVLAHGIDWTGNNKVLVPQDKGDMLLLLCPDFADKIARDGLSVADVQRLLFEGTRTPLDRWPRSYWPKLEARGYVESDGTVPLAARPEQFLIAVAGGPSGHHALYFCTFGLTWTVSVPFSTVDSSEAVGESCEIPAGGTR